MIIRQSEHGKLQQAGNESDKSKKIKNRGSCDPDTNDNMTKTTRYSCSKLVMSQIRAKRSRTGVAVIRIQTTI